MILEPMTEDQPSKRFMLLSLSLFIPSLAFGGACTNGSCEPGIYFLAFGTFGFFATPTNLAWLANPALFVAWINARGGNSRIGLASSVLAVTLSLLPLGMTEIATNEGGVATRLEGFGIGYWLWVGSTLVMLAGYIIVRVLNRGH